MNSGQKYLNTHTFALLVIVMGSIWLSACNVDLSGSAGQSESETPPPVIAPTEAPLLPTPTATPIPAPTGHIAFISDRDGMKKLYVMNVDGSDQRRLTDLASEDDMPRWAPGGMQIAFISTVDENTDIFIYDLEMNALIRVTDDPAKDSAPSWSPDGRQLVFESFRDGNLEIYSTNADGTDLIRLTDDPSGDTCPAWSPDGSKIAFISNRFGNSDIFLMDSRGGNLSTLTTSPAPESDPAWSPDSQIIAYRSWPSNEQADICLVSRNAVTVECIAKNQGKNGAPVWSPNGQWLAFYSARGGTFGFDVINMETRQMINLYTGSPARGDPTWVDNVYLAYQADAGSNMDIFLKTIANDGYVLFTDGENVPLTSQPTYDGNPHWTSQ
jgi:Tol biopolymer transport system component